MGSSFTHDFLDSGAGGCLKRLPYYKMYPQDFDCDEKVRLLNMKEAGLFLFALNHAWVNDGLPSEPDEIARVLRVPLRDFRLSWPRVSVMFAADCCGRLRNKRQEAERLEATSKSLKATESINVRWKSDTNVSKTNEVRMQNELLRARVSDSDSDSDKTSPLPPKGESEEFENLLGTVSEKIHVRHPAPHRDISVNGIASRLRTICKKVGARKMALLEEIDESHAAHCSSDQWTKNGGQFAKGLGNWLAPTKMHWEDTPPATPLLDEGTVYKYV
jgi:hypothetical protein